MAPTVNEIHKWKEGNLPRKCQILSPLKSSNSSRYGFSFWEAPGRQMRELFLARMSWVALIMMVCAFTGCSIRRNYVDSRETKVFHIPVQKIRRILVSGTPGKMGTYHVVDSIIASYINMHTTVQAVPFDEVRFNQFPTRRSELARAALDLGFDAIVCYDVTNVKTEIDWIAGHYNHDVSWKPGTSGDPNGSWNPGSSTTYDHFTVEYDVVRSSDFETLSTTTVVSVSDVKNPYYTISVPFFVDEIRWSKIIE